MWNGGFNRAMFSDCTVTPRGAIMQLTFRPLTESNIFLLDLFMSHQRDHKDRLHILDVSPSCISSSNHQAVLFHFMSSQQHTDWWLLITVMHTLMDVLNMHLIPNCERGRDLQATLIQSARRVEGRKHFGCSLLLSFYYDAGFLDFSSLGDYSQ